MTHVLEAGIIYKLNYIDDSYGESNSRFDEVVVYELPYNGINKAVFINGKKKNYIFQFNNDTISKGYFLTQKDFDNMFNKK